MRGAMPLPSATLSGRSSFSLSMTSRAGRERLAVTTMPPAPARHGKVLSVSPLRLPPSPDVQRPLSPALRYSAHPCREPRGQSLPLRDNCERHHSEIYNIEDMTKSPSPKKLTPFHVRTKDLKKDIATLFTLDVIYKLNEERPDKAVLLVLDALLFLCKHSMKCR